ncbi:VWA domain-containing protein [Enterococcus sp. BWB1-3]|uniref:vWA domain-containing protein n=1 Tax=Enterococcus sp. BWB1-3 TaxID=2787713 RepID=UPI001921685F|nr:vWA domain-containing protein [Enterococcus sp. BWB1-3]MBL1230530.1 VWA domain-containing protein [Enterococcus sp. BWB1-3]
MKKKFVLLVILLLGGLFVNNQSADASEKEGLDVVVVIDASYSMAFHDPEKNVYDAIRTVSEASLGSENRVGYVLYNDSIVKDKELTTVSSRDEIESWVQDAKSVTPVKGTDVGLGLKTAQRMLKAANPKADYGMILVISDGDTESDTSNPNRTQEAVNADVEAVLHNSEVPIYFIQYSQQEYRNREPMNQWSSRTGGQSHSVQHREELLSVVAQCFKHEEKRMNEAVTAEKALKKEEQFTLSIPVKHTADKQVKKLIVTMTSESFIKEVVYDETNELSVQENGNQVIVTIKNPKKENYVLKYKTENNQQATTSTYTKMTDLPKEKDKKKTVKTINQIMYLAAGVILLGGIIIVMFGFFNKKKILVPIQTVVPEKHFFSDSLEGCFIKTPDDQEIPIQNWPGSLFQNSQTITLYELFAGTDINLELSLMKKVYFRVGKQNTLQMKLKSGVSGIQNGQPISTGTWAVLSIQQGAYLIFKEDELELDIHIRKKSGRGEMILG